MPSPLIDEEKGEGGFKIQQTVTKETALSGDPPLTPSSQAPTLVGRTSSSFRSRVGSGLSADVNTFCSKVARIIRSRSASSQAAHRNPSREEGGGGDEDDGDDDDSDSDDDEQGTSSIVRKIHRQPEGYPRLASFLDCDESFMVYRRFGYVNSRLILQKQDEIAELEQQLDVLEWKEARNEHTTQNLTARRHMTDDKQALFAKLEVTCNAYTVLLQNASALVAMNRPTSSEQRSVLTWMQNTKGVEKAERDFIRHNEDLVTLRPGREHAWLDSGVENMLKWCRCTPIRRLFQSQDTRRKSDGKDGTILYTRSRIENCVVSIITLMILALLIIPVWALYRFSQHASGSSNPQASLECIGVLLVSTLAFSACICLFTRAKRHEILAASAAYCAVLVVFFGNLGTPNIST